MEENKTKNTEKSAEKVAKTAENTASKLKSKLKEASKNHTVKFLLSVAKNPATAIKENINDYSDLKSAWQLPVFTGLAYTVLNLINTIFSKVYVPAHKSFFGKQIDAAWNWKNLNDINWIQTIFTQFFSFLLPVLFVAGIYHLVALLFKKKTNFFHLTTIVTIAGIPAILATSILAPLASIISPFFGFIVMMAGISFSSITAYENLNAEADYKGNERIFANVAFLVALYIVLLILDGFGHRLEGDDNSVLLANTPNLDRLKAQYAYGTIDASERMVGLPSGQFGNSEVGHLNIGAGRVVAQDITRIDMAIENGSLAQNPALTAAALTHFGQHHWAKPPAPWWQADNYLVWVVFASTLIVIALLFISINNLSLDELQEARLSKIISTIDVLISLTFVPGILVAQGVYTYFWAIM